jgi:hypothetical protein
MAAELPVAHLAFAEPPVLSGFKARCVDPPRRSVREIADHRDDAPPLDQQFGKHARPVTDKTVM